MEESKSNNDLQIKDAHKDDDNDKKVLRTSAGLNMSDSINKSVRQAAHDYAKPENYDRSYFDDAKAKIKAKEELFKDSKTKVDSYTGKRLVSTQSEAQRRYRGKWQDHSAESDHIVPLKNIYEKHQNNPWLTAEDIKNASNIDANIQVTSRKFNNAKRDRSNKEFVEDSKYIKDKNVPLTEAGKKKALADEKRAVRQINTNLAKATVRNAAKTGHIAGMEGAQSAGINTLAMSGIMNVVSVIKGEKEGIEAIEDTLKDGGKAAVTGYALSGSMTVISHSLSASSSKFIQALLKSNVPGKAIAVVTTFGNTFKRYVQGEITTEECLLEVGESGLNLATMGYFGAVGQALIPIPVIGSVIGALVGSALTSTYFNQLMGVLRQRELEHQERLRIIAECKKAEAQLKKFKEELQNYLASYFKDYEDCFDDALSNMKLAYQMDNADDIIASANEITYKVGGTVTFKSVDEFKDFFDSNLSDEL